MARKKRGGEKRSDSTRKRGPQRRVKSGSRQASKDLVDHAVMKALVKPLRAQILAILAERIASPKEIAEELGRNLGTVSYHVTVIAKCGLIELDYKVPRRGAVEHFYRASHRTVLPPDAWDDLPPAMKGKLSACILKEFLNDASASMEAGVFDDPPGELSWMPLILDEPGIAEVGQLTRDFLESVLDVQAEASKRLPNGNGKAAKDATSATVFLASFLSARSPKEGKKASATKKR